MTDKPSDIDLNDPDSLRRWAARQPLVPLPDDVEVRFDFIAVHLRLRRNARRAWALTAFLMVCSAAAALAGVWTGDARFEATMWVLFSLMLPAGIAASSLSGRAEKIEKRFEQ